jgi:two-component system response regulator
MPDDLIDLLLVEDSPDDAALFELALKGARLHVGLRVARDGIEALELLFGSTNHSGPPTLRPKLILLDLKMPRMDGTEVLRVLKGNPHTRTIPVVVLSSSQEKQDLANCYRLGANSYLVKPMDFDIFNETAKCLVRYWLHLNQPPV